MGDHSMQLNKKNLKNRKTIFLDFSPPGAAPAHPQIAGQGQLFGNPLGGPKSIHQQALHVKFQLSSTFRLGCGWGWVIKASHHLQICRDLQALLSNSLVTCFLVFVLHILCVNTYNYYNKCTHFEHSFLLLTYYIPFPYKWYTYAVTDSWLSCTSSWMNSAHRSTSNPWWLTAIWTYIGCSGQCSAWAATIA